MRLAPALLASFATTMLAAACAPDPVAPPPRVVDGSQPSTKPSTKPSPLPDPPTTSRPTAPDTVPTPPPARASTPPPSPPTTPGPSQDSPVVASAPIPLEFHVQVSGQDFKPEAKGLADTLVYPTGLPIYHDRVAIVYEWRPADGKEKRLNPRTQKPYGPIWRPSIAEQMEPENLTRHLNTMGAWLDIYVPRSFSGIVCLDVESWPLKNDDFHMDQGQRDANARHAPGKKTAQLMSEFIRATQARARQLRPNVKAWGWWGMGGMHPAWPLWKPDQYEAWKRTDLEGESHALASIEVPMPSFYFADSFNSDAERIACWEKVRENWIAMYGRDRLIRDGYAYLNITHGPGPKAGQPLTREQFHECLEQARAVGMRRFVIWDYVDGPQKRDTIQKFLDQVLKPEVEAVVAQDKADQDRATARRTRDATPPPTREPGVPTRPAGRD